MGNRRSLVCLLAVLVFGLTLVAGAVPRDELKPVTDHGVKRLPIKASLVGEWLGMAQTRNDHFVPESLNVDLFINAEATVTGHLGTWKLADGMIRRTTAKERQDFQSEFVITAFADGMKFPEGGMNQVFITIDFKGRTAEGTVRGFATEKKGDKVVSHRWNLTHINKYPM